LLLRRLAADAHAVGDLGHRLRRIGKCDRAQNLPARAGQAEFATQVIAPFDDPPIQPEDRQDDFGNFFAV
jgi:hypothetical protein